MPLLTHSREFAFIPLKNYSLIKSAFKFLAYVKAIWVQKYSGETFCPIQYPG